MMPNQTAQMRKSSFPKVDMLKEAAESSKGLMSCDVNGIHKIQTHLVTKAMPFSRTDFTYTS